MSCEREGVVALNEVKGPMLDQIEFVRQIAGNLETPGRYGGDVPRLSARAAKTGAESL